MQLLALGVLCGKFCIKLQDKTGNTSTASQLFGGYDKYDSYLTMSKTTLLSVGMFAKGWTYDEMGRDCFPPRSDQKPN